MVNFTFMFFFSLSIFGAIKKEWSQSILQLFGILGGQKKKILKLYFIIQKNK